MLDNLEKSAFVQKLQALPLGVRVTIGLAVLAGVPLLVLLGLPR